MCGGADPDRNIPGQEKSQAMYNRGVLDVEFDFRFFNNCLCDRWGELCIAVVVKRGHGFAFVVIAYPTFIAAVTTSGE